MPTRSVAFLTNFLRESVRDQKDREIDTVQQALAESGGALDLDVEQTHEATRDILTKFQKGDITRKEMNKILFSKPNNAGPDIPVTIEKDGRDSSDFVGLIQRSGVARERFLNRFRSVRTRPTRTRLQV